MASEEYKKIQKEYKQYVKQCGIDSYMFYSPTDEEIYWKEHNKVLIVNMEPYGYQGEIVNIDKNELLRWLYDDTNTGTKTTRYSVLFASLLLEYLEDKNKLQRTDIQTKYYNKELLENTLSRITIYNIRPTSNNRKEQDVYGILNSAQGKLGEYLKNEILSLDAKYIIVSGKAGLESFKRIFEIKQKITKNMPVQIGKTTILAVNHFSRPSYNTWIKNIQNLTTAST